MSTLNKLQQKLKKLASPKRAKASAWFFKTKPGQYGAGDTFIGITVPKQRQVAKQYAHLPLTDIAKLLKSPIHEFRFTALEILVAQYEIAVMAATRQAIVTFYLRNTRRINNWDLVDTSAPYILGNYTYNTNAKILYTLARSQNLWERRIAIVATQDHIRQGKFNHTLKIAIILLSDTHDLIHKAVGWMLREVGKKHTKTLVQFLNAYASRMPRTTLRYAIERLPQSQRKKYLSIKQTYDKQRF